MTANHTATATGTTFRTTREDREGTTDPEVMNGSHRSGSRTTAAWSAFGAGVVNADDVAAAEAFDLPGADLSSEEITDQVLPMQADEFTCTSCFLVHHRSQMARRESGQLVCADCAA